MGRILTFEEFLQECHATRYVGFDDDMPDDFDRYMENLEPDDLLLKAQQYGDYRERMAKG